MLAQNAGERVFPIPLPHHEFVAAYTEPERKICLSNENAPGQPRHPKTTFARPILPRIGFDGGRQNVREFTRKAAGQFPGRKDALKQAWNAEVELAAATFSVGKGQDVDRAR